MKGENSYMGLVKRSEYGWQKFKRALGVWPVIALNSRMKCDWSEYPLSAAMAAKFRSPDCIIHNDFWNLTMRAYSLGFIPTNSLNIR